MGETVIIMTTKNYNVMHSAESNNHVDIYQVRNDVPQSEINEAVYAALCLVAEEVLKRSSCFISGERTAAELGGTIGKFANTLAPLSENENHLQMAPEVRVEVGTWKCNLPTAGIFRIMAEWEGVMGLTMKQTYRFQCEAKIDAPQDLELKAYKRCRVAGRKRVSVRIDNENALIRQRRLLKEMKKKADGVQKTAARHQPTIADQLRARLAVLLAV